MAQILIESEALESLKRMVEELEKDAARYRCIVRNLHKTDGPLQKEWDALDKVLNAGDVPSKEQFDAAIDAAMSKE